jgi:hypothetical protein
MSRQSTAIAVKKRIGLDSVGRILCNLRAGRGTGGAGAADRRTGATLVVTFSRV